MRLSGLTLETEYFEDYLSFLTEVLELDLFELTDDSMKLDLNGTWLEIVKVESAPHQAVRNVEFSMEMDEFEALKQKLSFFYYRRGPSRFLIIPTETGTFNVVDPDGRAWQFKNLSSPMKLHSSSTHSVRIF